MQRFHETKKIFWGYRHFNALGRAVIGQNVAKQLNNEDWKRLVKDALNIHCNKRRKPRSEQQLATN